MVANETRSAEERRNGQGYRAGSPTWSPRRVVLATLTVLAVVLLFWLAYRFRLVVFGVFEAIVFGTAIRPLVESLQRIGVPRTLGAALVFILVLAFLAGLILLMVPLFTEQGGAIWNTLLGYYQGLRDMLFNTGSIILQRLSLRLPATISVSPPAPAPGTQPLEQVPLVLSYGTTVIHATFVTLTVLLLTFYWTIDRDRILRSMLLLLPSDRRTPVREFIEATEEKVGAYLRGLVILCGAIGVLSLLAYLLIGLPYVVLLGVMAGLMEAVPLIGPLLGAIPAILVALALDPTQIIWVVVATVIIQTLENNLLVPRVMDQSVGINPVVSLLAFVIFSSLFGLAGALLAIPLAATLQLIFRRTMLEPASITPPAGRDSISVLRYEARELIMDVRKQVREKETVMDDPSDQVEDAIEAIVNDLDSILAQAEQTDLETKEEPR